MMQGPKNMLQGILEKFQMTKDKDVSSQIPWPPLAYKWPC